MDKRYNSYDELKQSYCEGKTVSGLGKTKKGEHHLWFNLLGDGKPCFCVKCGNWTSNIPKHLLEDI